MTRPSAASARSEAPPAGSRADAPARPPGMRLDPDGWVFTLLLAAISALAPLAIDMGLPALGPIAQSLRTRPATAGLTLSLFMAGFAIGPLGAGPLSDRLGRRRLLLCGLGLYGVGATLAALAPGIDTLLAARMLQGAGAGTDATLAYAVVRDLFSGRAAHRRIASVAVISTTAPMIAPTLGALILSVAGWRAIYGLMAAASVLVLGLVTFGLAETLPPVGRSRGLLLPSLVADILSLGRNRAYLLCGGIGSFGFAALFSYVSGSPLVVMGRFGASRGQYALLFACTSLSILSGAFLNGRLGSRMARPEHLLAVATSAVLAVDLALLGLTLAHALSLVRLVPLLLATNLAFGLGAASATHGALEAAPGRAGSASGLLTTVQMVIGALGSMLVSALFPRLGILGMTGPMAGFALAASLCWLTLARMPRPAASAQRSAASR